LISFFQHVSQRGSMFFSFSHLQDNSFWFWFVVNWIGSSLILIGVAFLMFWLTFRSITITVRFLRIMVTNVRSYSNSFLVVWLLITIIRRKDVLVWWLYFFLTTMQTLMTIIEIKSALFWWLIYHWDNMAIEMIWLMADRKGVGKGLHLLIYSIWHYMYLIGGLEVVVLILIGIKWKLFN